MHWRLHLNEPSEEDYFPPSVPDHAIPKIIHLTFPAGELPPQIKSNIDFINALNPDYEVRFYDDETIQAFIASHYPQRVLDLYLSINPKYGASRADLFRYLCVYKCGGVYLDIKSTTTLPLSSVLRPDDTFILAQWDPHAAGGRYASWGRYRAIRHVPGGEFQQWHVIASPGHPFLRAAINQVLANIERYNPFLHGAGRRAVINTTGPVAYTCAIAAIRSKHPHRAVKIERDLGLKYSIFLDAPGPSHHALFRNHYGDLMESLVLVGNPWESLFLAANRAHWNLRARLRGNRLARMLKNLVFSQHPVR